jgi:hypothetical protein
LNILPDVLKIDVEGHEIDVLLGGLMSLENIKVVQFEFGGTNIDSRNFFRDFWILFEEKNFSIYRVTPEKLLKLEKYSEALEVFIYANYIALNKKFLNVAGDISLKGFAGN